jgi:hypothetical protein
VDAEQYDPFLYFNSTVNSTLLNKAEFEKFVQNTSTTSKEMKRYITASELERNSQDPAAAALSSEWLDMCLPSKNWDDIKEARKWFVGKYSSYSEISEYSWCPAFNNAGSHWFWVAELMTVHNRATSQIHVFKYELYSEG